MKPLRAPLGILLAGCVLFAGFVGLSPFLHWQVEHGGNGRMHVHLPHETAHGRHSHHHHHTGHHHHHRHTCDDGVSGRSARFAHEEETPQILRLPGRGLIAFLGGATESETLPKDSAPDLPGHTHDSLSQMFLDGLVAFQLDQPYPPAPPITRFLLEISPESVLLPWSLDRHAASRAPPLPPPTLA